VFGRLNRPLAAAVFAVAALAAPPAAFACDGGPSAVNVYKECVPSGGGGKPTGQQTGPGAEPTVSSPVSSTTAKALRGAGKDRRVLQALVRSAGPRLTPESQSSPAGSPSALGSAFDLGSGPTALLIVLAGTALLLLGGSSLRLWRTRHRA
jgi:hypothetical protein